MSGRFLRISALIVAAVIAVAAFSWQQNNALVETRIDLTLDGLPEDFGGYRIVQIADLHSKMFGRDQEPLVLRVKAARPDIIVFTGDIVDRRHYAARPALVLVERLREIAPVYFVTGNHEYWSGRYDSLEPELIKRGVRVLHNESLRIRRGESAMVIAGIDDPAITAAKNDEAELVPTEMRRALRGVDEGDFTILLAHRPELIATYSQFGVELVYSGHAHGGQVRLPFVGGLFSPDQGFFPKYQAGAYEVDGSVLVVTRGLGNSVIPQRIFNRPEIVTTVLRSS